MNLLFAESYSLGVATVYGIFAHYKSWGKKMLLGKQCSIDKK
jgi:hypothetical protein